MNYREMFCRLSGLLIIGWTIAVVAGTAKPPKTAPVKLTNRNQKVFLEYLESVTYLAGKAIRLYYVVDCHANERIVPFPAVKLRRPSKDNTGLSAVREVFGGDKTVTIAEEPVGIIRIRIGNVPTAILQTRLSSVTLDKYQQYDPSLAIGAIEGTKEMEAAEKALRLTAALNVSGLVQLPFNGMPHLSESMRDLTVDQALDVVAKTLQGVVTYGICANPTSKDGPTHYWIEYTGGIGTKGEGSVGKGK